MTWAMPSGVRSTITKIAVAGVLIAHTHGRAQRTGVRGAWSRRHADCAPGAAACGSTHRCTGATAPRRTRTIEYYNPTMTGGTTAGADGGGGGRRRLSRT